jgi:phosphoribosylformimino-5-aminoimidazole carboxamide ribonucleotide (ProFAR) isomerase
MEQSMVVDLTPQIEDLKKTMNSALNQTLNKNIRLEGTVKSININTLQSRSEEIFVRAIINGNIAVKVK